VFNEKAAKKVLAIPQQKKIDVVITLGYAAKPLPLKIRKSLPEISVYNRSPQE